MSYAAAAFLVVVASAVMPVGGNATNPARSYSQPMLKGRGEAVTNVMTSGVRIVHLQ